MKPNSNPLGVVVSICFAFALCASCVSTSRTFTTKTGLRYEVVVSGSGPAALPGQSVRIHETLTLADGTLIYSTRTKNNPVKFLLGGNQVIAGVDEGVTGMRLGERRKLVVPPSLQSERSVASIPAGATLYYDIELVEILAK